MAIVRWSVSALYSLSHGDSLWSIAKEYSDVDSYASYTDYIDEVKQINHISGDDIHAGEYLTIPYYSAQVR